MLKKIILVVIIALVGVIIYNSLHAADYWNPKENLPKAIQGDYLDEVDFISYISEDSNLADFCLYFTNLVEVYDSVLSPENLTKHNLNTDLIFKLRDMYVYGASGKDLFMFCVSSDNKNLLFQIYQTYIYAQVMHSDNTRLQTEFLHQIKADITDKDLEDFQNVILFMINTSNLLKFFTYKDLAEQLKK